MQVIIKQVIVKYFHIFMVSELLI